MEFRDSGMILNSSLQQQISKELLWNQSKLLLLSDKAFFEIEMGRMAGFLDTVLCLWLWSSITLLFTNKTVTLFFFLEPIRQLLSETPSVQCFIPVNLIFMEMGGGKNLFLLCFCFYFCCFGAPQFKELRHDHWESTFNVVSSVSTHQMLDA